MKKWTAKEKKALAARNLAINELIYDLSALKQRAMKLELYTSFHAIDAALSKLGWQYANILTEQRKQGIIQ
jgi:hypothetical protein